MSGVTCSAFRRLIKKLNPGSVGLVVSEFISVEALTRNVRRSLQMMKFEQEEHPVSIQIFGYDIERMCQAAKMVEESGARIVDINCGCPAPKVVKKGGGCELMRQPEHLASLLKALRASVSMPLTLKMRAGWEENKKNALEIAHIAESEGVEALAVHGRTRAQMYRGVANWDLVQEVADAVQIPVFGSGDVTGKASAEERITGRIAGALIGRASMENPFVFSEIAEGKTVGLRSKPELQLEVVSLYIQLLKEELPPQDHARAIVGKLKQIVSQMCRGNVWRKDLLLAKSFQEQEETLKRALGDPYGYSIRHGVNTKEEELSCSL